MLIDMIVQMMHEYYAWFKMSIWHSSYIWHGIGKEWQNCISYARGHRIKWLCVHGHNYSSFLVNGVVSSVLWTTYNRISRVHFIALNKAIYWRLSNAFE